MKRGVQFKHLQAKLSDPLHRTSRNILTVNHNTLNQGLKL